MGGFLSPKARRTAKGVFLAFETEVLTDDNQQQIIIANGGDHRPEAYPDTINATTFEEYLSGWGSVGEVADRVASHLIKQVIETWGDASKTVSWLKQQLPESEHRNIDSPGNKLADTENVTLNIVQQMCGKSATALRAFCKFCKCEVAPPTPVEEPVPVVADPLPNEPVLEAEEVVAQQECTSPDDHIIDTPPPLRGGEPCNEQQAEPVEQVSDAVRDENDARQRLLARMASPQKTAPKPDDASISMSELQNAVAHLSSLRMTLQGISVRPDSSISYTETKASPAYFASPPLPYRMDDNKHLYRSPEVAPPDTVGRRLADEFEEVPRESQRYNYQSVYRPPVQPSGRSFGHFPSSTKSNHLSYVVGEATRISTSNKRKSKKRKVPFTLTS